MKLNARFYFLSLAALLFVLSLVVVPRDTRSAGKDEGKRDRSAGEKPSSASREGVAGKDKLREKDDQPTSVGTPPSSPRKPGALRRIANYFKGVFVPSKIKSAKTGQDDEINGDDPDLPAKKFMRNGIDKEEYLRLRDEYIASLRGLDAAYPLNPELRVKALNQMQNQQAEITRAAQSSKGNVQPALSLTAWTEVGPRPIPN